MTLIESLYLLAVVSSAIGGAAVMLHDGLGPLAAVLGALAGGLAVPIFFGALFLVLCAVEQAFTGRPYWPACTACGALEFKYESSPGPVVMRCGCGRGYVRHGRQLRQVLPGGASRPHLRWRPLRGWIRDDDPTSTTHADPPYRSDSAD